MYVVGPGVGVSGVAALSSRLSLLVVRGMGSAGPAMVGVSVEEDGHSPSSSVAVLS